MVLRGGNLEIKLGLVFWSSLHSNNLRIKRMLLPFKRGVVYSLKIAHNSWSHYFVIFLGALQFEATVPKLRTFHMDLHPPTHVKLNISTWNVYDI